MKIDHYYVVVKKAQPPAKAVTKRAKLCYECGDDWFNLIDVEGTLLSTSAQSHRADPSSTSAQVYRASDEEMKQLGAALTGIPYTAVLCAETYVSDDEKQSGRRSYRPPSTDRDAPRMTQGEEKISD